MVTLRESKQTPEQQQETHTRAHIYVNGKKGHTNILIKTITSNPEHTDNP